MPLLGHDPEQQHWYCDHTAKRGRVKTFQSTLRSTALFSIAHNQFSNTGIVIRLSHVVAKIVLTT
jgi:hypothetical protein